MHDLLPVAKTPSLLASGVSSVHWKCLYNSSGTVNYTPQALKQNPVSTGSAADLCKLAMIRIFAAVATSPTLTARSVKKSFFSGPSLEFLPKRVVGYQNGIAPSYHMFSHPILRT